MAQTAPELGGEISRTQSFDVDGLSDGSANTWSMTRVRLKLDHQASEDVRAHVNLKMYTVGASQFDWKLSEAYIDNCFNAFNIFDVDLRIGMQIISWGTAYQINPTDVINPYDLSEQTAFIPEDKLGVSAIRANYYPSSNVTLTGVIIPYFVPAFEEPGAALPEKTLNNSEYAFKITAQSIMGWDFSASTFKGKEDSPSNGHYRDVNVYGGDVIGTLWEMALWAEGAYTKPKGEGSYYEIVAGGEYTFDNDLYVLGQFYHRNYPDAKENYLMAVLRYPFRDIHTLQLGMAYEIENEIFVVFPEVTLSQADAVSLVLSGIFVEGDIAGTFMNQLKERLFLKLEYSF
jgi:hypothetical protein